MKKLLFLLPLLLSSSGCVSMVGIAEQLKNDPATVDVSVSTIYGNFIFHRAFPTNYVAPTIVFGSPAPAGVKETIPVLAK